MHTFYTVFDKDAQRIGLAPKADCAAGTGRHGCQDARADNYDPTAVISDEASCLYTGCNNLLISELDSCSPFLNGVYFIHQTVPTIDGRPHYVGTTTSQEVHMCVPVPTLACTLLWRSSNRD